VLTAEERKSRSQPHTDACGHLQPQPAWKDFAFFDPDSLGPKVEYIPMGDFLGASRQDGLEALTSEIVRKTLDEEPSIVVVDSTTMLGDFVSKRELRRAAAILLAIPNVYAVQR
jgi:circadian clock protein KaiC